MKKIKIEITEEQYQVLKAAVSYFSANVPDAEESLDINIQYDDVNELEKVIYSAAKN